MSTPPKDPSNESLAEAYFATREQTRAKYQGYLRQVWKQNDNCPLCDSSAWNLGDLIDAPVRDVAGDRFFMGQSQKVYVYAPVTCTYCGFTMFFHTGVLDVRGTEEVKAVPPLRFPEE
jgi:hypothetical protein